MLEGAAYDEDREWPHSARGLAKQAFTLAFIGLTASGTVALTAAAILLLLWRACSTT